MKHITKNQIRLKKRERGVEKAVVTTAFSQILIMVLSCFAFAFIIGGMTLGITPEIKADIPSFVPSGCCMEAKDGSICQNMNKVDEQNMCKDELISTDCNLVEDCQIGCCYDPNGGSCSFNSPKQKCLSAHGNWSNNAQCNIPQCNLGCCIFGDEASITTSRECTKLSQQLNFDKNFQALDSDGSCKTKTGLSKKGACVSPSSDYGNENNCKFTIKSNCKSGSFHEGFLCTAPELNTICRPSKNTTCLPDKDQIYFTDTCGNTANIYDSSKLNNSEYWTNVISPSSSCSNPGKDCGNCNYISGSRCYQYRTGKDTKPIYGDNVCRDLSCLNGRKHGESWCVSDYNSGLGTAPVGSRYFMGKCLDGEITLEPCADFNQEVCIEQKSQGLSEAKCTINNWRSCLAANDKSTYGEVEQECKKYDQCIMFLDIPGNEKYENLPGFVKGETNVDNVYPRGNAGSVGENANKIIPFCVPKYTPGMVFWNTNDKTSKFTLPGTEISSNAVQQTSQQSFTGLDYGGSLAETSAICSLGSFTCVSHTQKKPANTGNWKDKENPECNIDAVSEDSRAKVPMLMEALNERCRSLGPCGVYVNVVGEVGGDQVVDSFVNKVKINAKGKTEEQDAEGYALSKDYLGSLTGKSGLVKAGSLTKLTAAVISVLTGKVTEEADAQTVAEAGNSVGGANSNDDQTSGLIALGGGGLTLTGLQMTGGAWFGTGLTTGTALTGAGADMAGVGVSSTAAGELAGFGGGLTNAGAAGVAAIGAIAGYYIGKMIAKSAGMTPGQTTAFVGMMTGAGAILGVVGGATYTAWGTSATVLASIPVVGWIIIILAAVYMIYSYFFTGVDNEYYITKYTCEPWSAPTKADCNSCNNDIRTCSEYRCRSLGSNCHYYNENGEPGYCASLDATWSAQIKPWPEALSEGNKYTDIADRSFKIEAKGSEKVAGWENLKFGIITDDRATCKLDNVHTKTYDEMKYNFEVANENCEGANCASGQGINHRIVLSPFVKANGSNTLMPALVEGENNYYIRCRNFAGAVNEGEFAVKIIRDKGEDLTSPLVTRFIPKSEGYVKLGENSTQLTLFVNEPSECKYSIEVNNKFEDMTGNLTCITDGDLGIMGEWACFSKLDNLKVGNNKFYFQCRDQPDIDPRFTNKRNINRNSKEYSINVCSEGLNITLLEPKSSIIVGKAPIALTLTAETKGCVEGGRAICSYSFGTSSNGTREIEFLNTNAKVHTQKFTSMPSGVYNISVKCIDEANNVALSSINVNISIDNLAPSVMRAYEFGKELRVITDENSQCKFTSNRTIGCSFDYELDGNLSLMNGEEKVHTARWSDNQEYYIKCMDVFGNINPLCSISVKAV